MIHEVLLRPFQVRVDLRLRERSRLLTVEVAEPHHLFQVVAPGGRPQRTIHVARFPLLARIRIARTCEQFGRKTEGLRQLVAIRSITCLKLRFAENQTKALVVSRIVGGESGCGILRVVGRRALGHKAQSVRVFVGFDQFPEPRRRSGAIERSLHTEHEE